jgi:hydroxymethylpyrimidine pyrophosphatase-like HAD family hydrolase/orotate phosphoribosyltransferase
MTSISLTQTATLNAPSSSSAFIQGEADFYREYEWALSIYPTVAESLERLRAELTRCEQQPAGWRRQECLVNIYLHCSAVADTADDYLAGNAYDFSKVALIPFSGVGIRAFNAGLKASRSVRRRRLAGLHRWRHDWRSSTLEYVRQSLLEGRTPNADLKQRLLHLSRHTMPADLLAEVAKVPAAFRSQDMSHHDVVQLGKQFLESLDDRRQPLLIVGLRTAGSYFAPLLAAYLATNGCDVDFLTIRPKDGVAAWEQEQLAASARKAAQAIVIDEPINTGTTLLRTLELLRQSGFKNGLTALIPVHASRKDWQGVWESQALSRHRVVTLNPEQWYKRRLFSEDAVSRLMRDWFGNGGTNAVSVNTDSKTDEFNQFLDDVSEEKFHNRLKSVFRVDIQHEDGETEKRYVVAKSVGWGWYGYHAALAAEKLNGFVPSLVGFSDGVLFQEWMPHDQASRITDRGPFVERAADYVAARVRLLPLPQDPSASLAIDNRHKATDELSGMLSKAYGSKPASVLRRAQLRERLTFKGCPLPTLIDGKMRPVEWVMSSGTLWKTDFEQHGLGKTELSVIDPAYDLADAILHWKLSADEEQLLIDRYIAKSGDVQISRRLQLNKLVAGSWNMMSAVANLGDARLVSRSEEFNRAYLDAWTFLILHTTRFCGTLCAPPARPQWGSPLVVMDIDGVLDKQIFGFPSTTAAGIRAIALLHARNRTLAINTARSVAEVRDYCKAYHLVGGVAEYGAYAFDAISGREKVLVSPESLEQLHLLARELRKIPGVFLNDDYKYSLRAFTYQKGVTVAVPTLLIQNLISSLKLDRLRFHQTFLDTGVVAKETDKGHGLLALLELANQPSEGVIAIGDSEPDLPMFRVASHSYAPGQIGCRSIARLLGCRISKYHYQVGLLDIAQQIVRSDDDRTEPNRKSDPLESVNDDIFVEMLKVADMPTISSLAKAILHPKALASLRR